MPERKIKAVWSAENSQDLDNFSRKERGEVVGEVHMRNHKEPLMDPDRYDVLYYTLCGIIVQPENINKQPAKSWLDKKPTCMGCILVNFQNLAEAELADG